MNYKRLIPILLIKDGLLVRSELFQYHQAIGDPIPTIKRMSDWNVDELCLINIGSTSSLDSRRSDKWHNLGKTTFSGLVQQASKFCHCPLTAGGRISSLDDFNRLFESGADKCIVNSLCFTDSTVVANAVKTYGSQAVIGALDIKISCNGDSMVAIHNGKTRIQLSINEAINHLIAIGVGEILLSCIDADGAASGYHPEILEAAQSISSVPVIVNSGAVTAIHFSKALLSPFVDACAASNIFYFRELSYPILKNQLINTYNVSLRFPDLSSPFILREPTYDSEKRDLLLRKRDPDCLVDSSLYDGSKKVDIRYCTRCLYPSLSATPMQFDDDGVCMGCRVSDAKLAISKAEYNQRTQRLRELVRSYSGRGDYDCIVSVSGGKDSYYQVHYVTKVLGLKALLVTYNGNNYTEVGWRNLWRMREVFDCDHIVVSPSVSTLKSLNKLAFVVMGDMNWHAHVGIFTTAPRIAVQQNIPLIFWGEHGYADLCGQFSMNDYPEMNYRERTEHAARGFDWPFFVGIDGLKSSDLEPWKYPSDSELLELDLRQIYLGHYIPWESNEHLKLVVDLYGFEVSDEPFERTYRTGSNLDDMHENGVHDYLKYIKFGYGRCTDHASKDIRAGKLTRTDAIKLVNQMDPVKPKDLQRWLSYVGMPEPEFDRIANHFRDPRVWSMTAEGSWIRDSL